MTFAQVRVAFVEVKGYGGQRVELERNGRFAHVAVSYKGQWLQSYPGKGVELVSYADLVKMGKLVVLKSPRTSEPADVFVAEVLGKPFDMSFTWEGEGYYCSKLVAKFFDLQPLPMQFNPRSWPPSFLKLNGLPGLSPDDVYDQLVTRDFLHVSGTRSDPRECKKLL